jgi:hypothetical protein
MMIDDPLPDGDLPLRIRIEQQLVAGKDEQSIAEDADPQRQQPARGAGFLDRVGDGKGHVRKNPQGAFSGRSKHTGHNSR